MDPNKNCVFFAGGKKLNIDSQNTQSHLKLSKNTDGKVVFELKFVISKEEAEKAVFNFDELEVEEDVIGEMKPNMVYLQAYNNDLSSKVIKIHDGSFKLGYDKDVFSEIALNLIIVDSGKTDHAKTDHPADGE